MNWSILADVVAFFGNAHTCKLVICSISGRVFSFLRYSCTWIGQFWLMFSHFLGMHAHANWWFAAFPAEFFHFLGIHVHELQFQSMFLHFLSMHAHASWWFAVFPAKVFSLLRYTCTWIGQFQLSFSVVWVTILVQVGDFQHFQLIFCITHGSLDHGQKY